MQISLVQRNDALFDQWSGTTTVSFSMCKKSCVWVFWKSYYFLVREEYIGSRQFVSATTASDSINEFWGVSDIVRMMQFVLWRLLTKLLDYSQRVCNEWQFNGLRKASI